MKKTLFTMMAVALCGTAFGADYYTSDMVDTMLGEAKTSNIYQLDGTVRITVNSSVPTGLPAKRQIFNGAAETYFVDNISWTANYIVSFTQGVNITSTADVAESWLNALSDGDQITLFNNVTPNNGFNIGSLNLLFNGVEANGQVTLAGTELTFKGYGATLEALNLGDNEIGIVRMVDINNKATGYALVGNITSAATPEPATATLSLLALAGLATRRRRK